ncbi:MAG: ABC transporter substrate-binding protein [Acidimicrobiales bacterium]
MFTTYLKKRPLVAVLAVALVGLGTLGASSVSSASSSTPVRGGTLVYGTDREPTCLDPHNYGDMPQTYIARQFLDSLVSELPSGAVVPWLATSWKISANGLHYTFTLKQGVKFTDGTPFNAAAVVANFTQIKNPKTQSATDGGYLAPYYVSTTVVGPYTAEVNLKAPDAPLLDELAQAFFGIESPKAMARGETVNCQSPVGTGPFVVKNWVHGQSVTLVRNANYNSAPANAKHQGPAYLSGITWKFLEDSSVRFAALQSGEVPIIFNPPPQDQTELNADSSLSLLQFTHAGIPNGIAVNTAKAPFNNLQVRQAFFYAANAKAALQSAYEGTLPSSAGPLSSSTPDYASTYENAYNYNASKANALLLAAGWTGKNSQGYRTKNGVTLTARLVYSSNSGDTPPADLTLLQDIQASEKTVGIDVTLVPLGEAAYDNSFTSETNHELLWGAYWNSPTPAVLNIVYSTSALKPNLGNNSAFTSNPALDKILLEAAATTNTADQEKLYGQAQAIVSNNAWDLSIYPETTRLGISNTLHGVWIEPSEGEPVLSDAWLTS